MKGRVILPALLLGLFSSIFGTAALFTAFYFLIHAAENKAGVRWLNDSPMGMFEQNPQVAASAIAGVAFAFFAFTFFITYSRRSSRAEAGE